MTDDELACALSVWLTLALDGSMPDTTLDGDLMALRDWVDNGRDGDMPLPTSPSHPGADLAQRTTESIRVFWETRNWTPAQFRKALVESRLR